MPCETQQPFTCHNRRHLRHETLKHHHHRLQYLNDTSENVWTNNAAQ